MALSSDDANVSELPRILAIEVFGEQALSTVERCPIAMYPDQIPKIGPRDVDDAREIHFLGLDDALARMLERPDDAAEHRSGDLERGGVVVRRHPARLGDRQTRAEPIDAARRTHQQHAKLVGAAGYFLHHQPLAIL